MNDATQAAATLLMGHMGQDIEVRSVSGDHRGYLANAVLLP
jgi:hypothetical protein